MKGMSKVKFQGWMLICICVSFLTSGTDFYLDLHGSCLGSQFLKVSSAAQVDVIGPFLDQPGPHTENLCLTANSDV